MGLGQGNFDNSAVTPNRFTRIRYDVAEQVMSETPYAQERKSGEMALTELCRKENVRHMPRLGWELGSYTYQVASQDESTLGADQVLLPSNGRLSVAANHDEVSMWRSPTELLDATDGASNLATNGSTGVQKRIPAGESWKATLNGSGIPAPTNMDAPTIEVDRIASTTDPHDPNAALLVRFRIPGNGHSVPTLVARIVFCGPPSGRKATFHGKGLYCLHLLGNGLARCYEYGTFYDTETPYDEWDTNPRLVMRWAQPGQITNRSHALYIRPYAIKPIDQPSGLLYLGGGVEFTLGGSSDTTPGAVLSKWQDKPQSTDSRMFAVTASQPSGVLSRPAEIHFRRDMRPVVQVSITKYYASGVLRDDPFATEFHPTARQDFYLSWRGSWADGTSITATMHDAATGTQLAVIDDQHTKGWMRFRPVWGQKHFYVQFTLNGNSDQSKSPVLASYRVTRNGVTETVAPGEWSGGVLESVSITGPTDDPTHETASAQIADTYDVLTKLKLRGQIPMLIETAHADDITKKSILFRGYTSRAVAKRKGTKSRLGFDSSSTVSEFPISTWNRYDLTATGVWQRLSESLCARRFDWSLDPDGKPYKVSDAVRIMLQWAGWSESQLDIPDLDIKLFPPNGGGGQDLLVEPGADLGEFILRLVTDYLGHHLIFDPNASKIGVADELGMWRMIAPKVPPYKHLCNFVTRGPLTANRVVHNINAYEPTTRTDGVEIPTTYIRKGTYSSFVNPPECNVITVSGVGTIDRSDNEKALLVATVYNPASYNFAGLPEDHPQFPDPNHPDYLGRAIPLEFFDPCLTSRELVNFVIRRLATRCFHAQKLITFEAPLMLITDPDDQYQVRPRPLRYYDPVLLDSDTTALIRSVNPAYEKDGKQFCIYELEIPPPELT